ncbi:kinase-like domain-containing protein [Mycena floridula]|nr:kinase-like domain-containing protein [Mycena floridula]
MPPIHHRLKKLLSYCCLPFKKPKDGRINKLSKRKWRLEPQPDSDSGNHISQQIPTETVVLSWNQLSKPLHILSRASLGLEQPSDTIVVESRATPPLPQSPEPENIARASMPVVSDYGPTRETEELSSWTSPGFSTSSDSLASRLRDIPHHGEILHNSFDQSQPETSKYTIISTIVDLTRQAGSWPVLKATSSDPGQLVAVKVFQKARLIDYRVPISWNCQFSGHREATAVFHEVDALRVATDTGSRFVATMLDAFQDEVNYYIVMPFYPNSLTRLLDDFYSRKEALALFYIHMCCVDLLSAMEALHNASLYHCDIKTDNLMIGDDGHLILIDFDLCCFTKKTARYVGTVEYMAPEVNMGSDEMYFADKADVYSFGRVVQELYICPLHLTMDRSHVLPDERVNFDLQNLIDFVCYFTARGLDRSHSQQTANPNPNQRMSLTQIRDHRFIMKEL